MNYGAIYIVVKKVVKADLDLDQDHVAVIENADLDRETEDRDRKTVEREETTKVETADLEDTNKLENKNTYNQVAQCAIKQLEF